MSCEQSPHTLYPADFDAQRFLRHHWQQRPLLIRGNDRSFSDPITAEELAGLACEEPVESRLVQTDPEENTWHLRHGPFRECDFLELPESHCSLLVQAVDQWHEPSRALLQAFDFIPGWRIDDVMISYANDGGSVGPHFDYYDVFLIQGQGRKRWRLGQRCDSRTALREDTPLRLLQEFELEEEYITEPGDILYLPPGLAHHGISIGESMTCSVGFRAPSEAEITAELGTVLARQLSEDQRYRDPEGRHPAHPGEIPAGITEQLQQILRRQIEQPELIGRWFGEYMTLPRYPELPLEDAGGPVSPGELQRQLREGAILQKNPASRFAFQADRYKLRLFADGRSFECQPALQALIEELSRPGHTILSLTGEAMREDPAMELLIELMQQGSVQLQTPETAETTGLS